MQTNLDVKRLLCPMPVIRLGEMIEKIEIGDTIQIIATDPGVLQRSLKVKSSKRIIFFLPIKQSRQFFHHKQAPCAHAPCTKQVYHAKPQGR
jgi:hypothetical protein